MSAIVSLLRFFTQYIKSTYYHNFHSLLPYNKYYTVTSIQLVLFNTNNNNNFVTSTHPYQSGIHRIKSFNCWSANVSIATASIYIQTSSTTTCSLNFHWIIVCDSLKSIHIIVYKHTLTQATATIEWKSATPSRPMYKYGMKPIASPNNIFNNCKVGWTLTHLLYFFSVNITTT